MAGRELTALTANDDPVAGLAPGSAVVVGYHPPHAMTFADTERHRPERTSV